MVCRTCATCGAADRSLLGAKCGHKIRADPDLRWGRSRSRSYRSSDATAPGHRQARSRAASEGSRGDGSSGLSRTRRAAPARRQVWVSSVLRLSMGRRIRGCRGQGPLAPWQAGFEGWLLGRGYLPSAVVHRCWLLAAMSLWLQRRGLDGWGLTEERALLFVAERRAAGSKTWTSRSHRCLEVTPHLIGRLRTHKLASPISAQHDFVFAGRTGRGHDHRNIGGRVLARPVERAGLGSVHDDARGVLSAAPTFHSLRHTHASALIAHGWDIEEVRARVGHSSVATTQRIYVRRVRRGRPLRRTSQPPGASVRRGATVSGGPDERETCRHAPRQPTDS